MLEISIDCKDCNKRTNYVLECIYCKSTNVKKAKDLKNERMSPLAKKYLEEMDKPVNHPVNDEGYMEFDIGD